MARGTPAIQFAVPFDLAVGACSESIVAKHSFAVVFPTLPVNAIKVVRNMMSRQTAAANQRTPT
jgi:hypothetical protein